MNTAEDNQSQPEKKRPNIVLLGIASLLELAFVIALVFGIGWGLMRWAEVKENRPIGSGLGGDIALTASQGTPHGQLEKYPMDLENQAGEFEYFYGRKLDEERRGRRIGKWSDVKAYVEWTFQVDTTGRYRVVVELASSTEAAGSEFHVAVADQELTGIVPDTGGDENWQLLELGDVQLDSSGPHSLSITPVSIVGGNLMNLKQVLLDSADAEEDDAPETTKQETADESS